MMSFLTAYITNSATECSLSLLIIWLRCVSIVLTATYFERYAIVTRTDIADAMLKLEAHEREHVTEKGHVFSHTDSVDGQVAKGRIIN